MSRILVAIPAYNEEKMILEVARSLISLSDVHVVVFDDGSDDETHKLLIENGIATHRETINSGLAQNFQIMLNHFVSNSEYSWLITVDGDGQFNGSDIENLLAIAKTNNYDFISGSRFLSAKSSLAVPIKRRIPNIILAKLLTRTVKKRNRTLVTDATCGLRAYSKQSALHLLGITGHSYTIESILLLLHSDLNLAEIPITAEYFLNRKSHISGNLFKYGRYILSVLSRTLFLTTLKSMLGLLVINIFGSAFLILSFLMLSLRDGTFRGWLFLGGSGSFMLLTSLVLFGIYTNSTQAASNRRIINIKLDQIILAPPNNSAPNCKKCFS